MAYELKLTALPKDRGLTPVDPAVALGMLELSVRMRLQEFPDELPWETVTARCGELASVVASKGDLIMFKSKKKGETAAAFNALAEGLSYLAMLPGGVNFLGYRWEAKFIRRGFVE